MSIRRIDEDDRSPEERAADDAIRERVEEEWRQRKAAGKTWRDVECQTCGKPGKLRLIRSELSGRSHIEPPIGWVRAAVPGLRMSACSAPCAKALEARTGHRAPPEQ